MVYYRASKGLGYAFTCAALKAGDKVVAVARTIDNLAKLEETYQESLLPLNLDVTDREAVFLRLKQQLNISVGLILLLIMRVS